MRCNRSLQQCSRKMTSASKTSFPVWPKPMIQCDGDYRAEAHVERIIGGPLYEHQKNLLRLPIPEVKDTIQRFLPTAIPLAQSSQEKENLLIAAGKFEEQTKNLQQRLIQRMHEFHDSSWLQSWWNSYIYLEVRDPLPVNVSYFFHFQDDPTLLYKHDRLNGSTVVADHAEDMALAIHRGAAILHAVAAFRKKVCTGILPAEKARHSYLCSAAFKYMFHACRIPQHKKDSYRIYDPSRYQHVIVACRGYFFTFDFCDPSGHALDVYRLERNLQECIVRARHIDSLPESSRPPQLGWLTSSDRDFGAQARNKIIQTGGSSALEDLTILESGAILLCLDDQEEPVSRKQCADIFWTGGLRSGGNRWFDKSVQIMVTKNGKAGLIGEHSMMDGMPMIAFADCITKTRYSDISGPKYGTSLFDSPTINGDVKTLFSSCIENLGLLSIVQKSKTDFIQLIKDHDLHVLSFHAFGSDYIKSRNYSPDAFVQTAIQLALYRLLGCQVGTYEATQMRTYLHGRTETTRGVSLESADFVHVMGPWPSFNPQQLTQVELLEKKQKLMKAAVDAHVKCTKNASVGHGVDRHFLGLRLLCDGSGEELPALFQDPVFVRSKTWRASTSHLTHPRFENCGFGEVVPNGVGIGYGIKKDCCILNLTARAEHNLTEKLSQLLEEALLEMRSLIEVGHSTHPITKL